MEFRRTVSVNLEFTLRSSLMGLEFELNIKRRKCLLD